MGDIVIEGDTMFYRVHELWRSVPWIFLIAVMFVGIQVAERCKDRQGLSSSSPPTSPSSTAFARMSRAVIRPSSAL